MEVSILSDTNNPMMDRREIAFSVVQDDRTSSKDEIKQELCKKMNLSPESTIIVEVKQEFGMKRSSGMAHSYKTKEQMERSEPRYLIARLTKKGKKEAAPKEEPKKEEKKEEKKE